MRGGESTSRYVERDGEEKLLMYRYGVLGPATVCSSVRLVSPASTRTDHRLIISRNRYEQQEEKGKVWIAGGGGVYSVRR
jgi:hypothetical protein